MIRLSSFLVGLVVVSVGCATTNPAPAAPAAPPAAAAAPAASGKLTKKQLEDARDFAMSQYPAPFDKVFQSVTDKIGEPNKKGDNMNEWFASENGACLSFFMTKAAPQGTAAVGMYDTDAANCQ